MADNISNIAYKRKIGILDDEELNTSYFNKYIKRRMYKYIQIQSMQIIYTYFTTQSKYDIDNLLH